MPIMSLIFMLEHIRRQAERRQALDQLGRLLDVGFDSGRSPRGLCSGLRRP